uniref:Helicase C-terminal domain-containing protein n=1 Tax=Strongyloides venezuelensis TaxID=75913 RepID=A0A0K0FRG8_STRVS
MCGDIIDAENEMANNFVLPSRKTLVLVREKRTSDILAYFFIEKGIKALPINGEYYQEYREKAPNTFRSGMDINNLDHVMIVDLPNDFNTFIHRIGRTGRIKEGEVTTLYDAEDYYIVSNDINDMLQKAEQEVPNFVQ